ncbi:SusD/RagB family nutrient-binding outer membrane lipoprotein, partial [Sinomicrobium weinanense]
MKRFKYIIIAFLPVLAFLQGCETTELENLDDPNNLGPDQADPALLFNSIQTNYRDAVTTFNDIGGDLGRIEYMFGRVYRENYTGSALNGPWADLYSDMMPDITTIENLNADGSLNFVLGASKAMQAHIMMLLIDYMGDIVWTEANNPAEFPNPTLDDDEAVYQAALSLLDEAKGLLTQDNSIVLDMYYDGSAEKWVRFINTLKMRASLTLGDYQAVINASDVIEADGDNMVFEYGTNQLEPDNRHPDYSTDYTASGANEYRSNWLMNLMLGNEGDVLKEDDTIPVTRFDDPRRRYYFYRQKEVTPGNSTYLFFEGNGQFFIYPDDLGGSSVDAQTLICSTQETPAHIQFTPDEAYWCSNFLGYWGRTHGNAEGIPPDNFTRTASGVYPAGGRFDDNLDWVVLSADQSELTLYEAGVGIGLGAGGAGIEPIILSSFIEFWRAEAYFKLGNNSMAAEHMMEGLKESINYVASFGPRDGSANLSFAPSEKHIEDFINSKMDEFTNASNSTSLGSDGWPTTKDKMDIMGEQFFVAMYGAGADAYNFIRRTGYPRTLARSIEP